MTESWGHPSRTLVRLQNYLQPSIIPPMDLSDLGLCGLRQLI